MDARAAKRAKTEPVQVDACDAIRFHLLPPGATPKHQPATFRPEMAHQLFGEDEMISGHEAPTASVFISQLTFESVVEFVASQSAPGATEVKRFLEENFKEGALPDRQRLWQSHTAAEGLQPADLGSALCHRGEVSVHNFALSDAPPTVKTLHGRAQQLLTFFIDGATPLDQSEPDWDLLVAVKNIAGKSVLVGFCTLYRLYAYPASSRLRVSQVFVLPTYQHQGIGTLLLEAVYKLADSEGLHDVIYEEPTEEVEAIRERIELRRAQLLPWLLESAAARGDDSLALNGSAGGHPPNSLALGQAEVARACKEIRIPKQQVRRLWESLLIRQTPFKKEPGIFALRGLVARRLYGTFSDTKQQAVGKQIFNTDDLGSFCMRKVSRGAGLKGMPVALEDKQEEGQSTEEREAALEEAIEQRMEALLKHTASS